MDPEVIWFLWERFSRVVGRENKASGSNQCVDPGSVIDRFSHLTGVNRVRLISGVRHPDPSPLRRTRIPSHLWTWNSESIVLPQSKEPFPFDNGHEERWVSHQIPRSRSAPSNSLNVLKVKMGEGRLSLRRERTLRGLLGTPVHTLRDRIYRSPGYHRRYNWVQWDDKQVRKRVNMKVVFRVSWCVRNVPKRGNCSGESKRCLPPSCLRITFPSLEGRHWSGSVVVTRKVNGTRTLRTLRSIPDCPSEPTTFQDINCWDPPQTPKQPNKN